MAMKLYSDSDIQDIADAIRSKNGSSDTYKVSQMATAISNIPSGGGILETQRSKFTNPPYRITFGRIDSEDTAGNINRLVFYASAYNDSQNTHIGKGGSTRYVANTNLTTSDIGSSIFSKMRAVSTSSSNYYQGGPDISYNANSGHPYINRSGIFDYTTVTSTVNNTFIANKKYVTIDIYGTITGVFDTWYAMATALQNKEVDLSNGVMIIGTEYISNGGTQPQQNSMTFS